VNCHQRLSSQHF